MLIKNGKVLTQKKFKLEKDIQNFIEEHIPDILGEEYEFICTEFTVGDFRIDSLVFNNETKSFIIVEDKNVENKSLIDQGLTYLKLLRDRKSDFILKYNEIKNSNLNVNDIDLSQSKVVFFSPFYNKYQLYSSDYQNIPFDLYKITKYEDDIVDIEKIEKSSKQRFDNDVFKEISSPINGKDQIKVYTEDDHIKNINDNIREIYEDLKLKILELGDIDLEVKKTYIAFKGRKNIVDIELFKRKLVLFINLKKGKLIDNDGVADDISNFGHHGNGDYYVDIYRYEDIEKVIPLIRQSLEVNKK